ncbi:hypothetical protein PJIAN_1681 [Paludibacter jiangxiensis]|uniref:Uncharacterized protein n=1 Tax=Paludibacter jiangxiensis TaxID=681398 RepID=A0A170YV73_9BACT|nr:hypothetical protein PJIAN_1681 [Paludibacter jiangxiensis]
MSLNKAGNGTLCPIKRCERNIYPALKNLIRGFHPYNPDFLFALKQKGSKKFKAMPASLKKLAFVSGNRPNLFPPYVENFKQGRFFPLPLLFFGSPDKATPNLT